MATNESNCSRTYHCRHRNRPHGKKEDHTRFHIERRADRIIIELSEDNGRGYMCYPVMYIMNMEQLNDLTSFLCMVRMELERDMKDPDYVKWIEETYGKLEASWSK
jgi:hypothetical protein